MDARTVSLRTLVDRLEFVEHVELEQQLKAVGMALKPLDPPAAVREAFVAFATDLRHHLHLEEESVFFAVRANTRLKQERVLHAITIMNTQHDVGAGLEAALQHLLIEAGARYAEASAALLTLAATLHEHQLREDILGERIVAGELWPLQGSPHDVLRSTAARV